MTRSTDGVVRDLQRSLLDAGDAQISRIVAMVDALPERGSADALIAPLRPRLARLHPRRRPSCSCRSIR